MKNKNQSKKTTLARKKQQPRKVSTKRKVRIVPRNQPVSKVDTAPVAIGNSIRGHSMSSSRSRNGATIMGRDFCFTPIGTGAITTWTTVGGTPLCPAAFVDSKIRSYLQLYQKYRWKRCTIHYITSSATSATGDVMVYHAKNRDSVYLNQSSNLLLPFVMSDSDTCLGPQWTNHSVALNVVSDWKSTDYGMSDNPNEYSAGEVFLLSKTTTTDSPGYVLMDYEIEFAEEQVSPRLLTLPLARIQYSQVNLGRTAHASTVGLQFYGNVTGVGLNGLTSAIPTGAVQGDIYKVHFDVTNSSPASWTNVTTSTLLRATTGVAIYSSQTVSDGFTCYAVYEGSGGVDFQFYSTIGAAYTGQTGYLTSNVTATITWNLQVWMSYVGQIGTNNFVSNY